MESPGPRAFGAYVESIILKDFRCFEDATASFVFPASESALPLEYPNVNLVLGTNASGKSALLKGVALSLLAPIIPSSGYKPNHLLRLPRQDENQASDLGEIVANIRLNREVGQVSFKSIMNIMKVKDFESIAFVELPGESYWGEIFSNLSPAFFIAAYGATRRVELGDVDLEMRNRLRLPRYQRVAGLFEDYVALTPPGTWMKTLYETQRLDEAMSILSSLLPAEVQPEVLMDNSGTTLAFSAARTTLPFSALADGYRSFIGWVGDLLYHLATVGGGFSKLADIEGVVVVDEIDLHLHPEWQRVVVDRIAKAFPKLQFFLTTHSPLVTGSLQAANIMRCEIDAEGHRSIVPVESSPAGLSADQVLTSDFFGLDSVRSEVAEQGLADIAQRAMEGDADAAAMYLRRLTSGSDVSESL